MVPIKNSHTRIIRAFWRLYFRQKRHFLEIVVRHFIYFTFFFSLVVHNYRIARKETSAKQKTIDYITRNVYRRRDYNINDTTTQKTHTKERKRDQLLKFFNEHMFVSFISTQFIILLQKMT